MISTAELANTEFEGITLPDPYGDFLGEIPNDASMSIWGPPGSGKSTFAIALALILADKVGKGIYCSSEEGPGPSMKSKIKRLKAEHDNVLVSDYEGIERLKSAVEFSHSNFVVVDSISKSAITVAEFEEFLDWCKKQDVISIFILHTTKEGTYKGHTEFIHNPDIEIKVEDGLAKIDNKNRFQETPREMEVVFERGEARKNSNENNSNANERHDNLVIKEHFHREAGRNAEFDYFERWLAEHYPERKDDAQDIWDTPKYGSDRPEPKDKRENPATDTQCLVSAKAQTNEEKNGIEIQFSDAPPKWIRDQLKENGFTFYNPNDGESFWAAEKTAKRKKIIESIAGDLDQAIVSWKPKTSNQSDEQSKDTDEKELETKTEKESADEAAEEQKEKSSLDIEVPHILGNKTTVDFKADGSIQEQGRYAIVEAADLIPSHNKDCTPNSAHKISKGQPRDRSLDALCSQPKFIAQNLNPTSITRGNLAFNGAPTTLPDIQHIQGNGRGIALEIAYDEHPQNAKKYANYLEDNAADWGFTKSEIEQFAQPVLIRILDVSNNRAIELGNVVDTSQAKMSKVDQGKAYIRNLPKDQKQAVGNLINNSSGETLGEVINDVGLRIMDQFKDLDRQGLVEENSLTSEGKDFLRSVFAGLVFDSDENKQALQHFMNLKHTQKAGLQRAYGNIIPFIDTNADLTATIQKAVEITAQVQQKDGIDTVRDFMSQSDAFSGANKDEFSEQQAQLAQFLLDADTQKAIRNGFRMYQYKINGKEDLFNPIEKVSPEKAFKDAFVERIRINPDGEQVKLQAVSEFDTGEIIRDFYDTDKYEVVGTKDDNYIIKNTRTGKKENIAPDVRRFVPDRSETPTMELFDDFRKNPKDPLVYIGFTERIYIDTGDEIKSLEGEFPTFLSEDKLFIVPGYRVEKAVNAVDDEEAVEGFEEWHNYEADEQDFAIEWPDDEPEPIGTASKIWYGSDKIIREGDAKGELNYYVHDFDAGERPTVVKGDIMIVGNIDWNKRGLLN